VLCHTIAIWLTIALAIFRYICVCYPTRGAQLCSLKRAKLAIFAIYVTSAVVCIPNYMVSSDVISLNHSSFPFPYIFYLFLAPSFPLAFLSFFPFFRLKSELFEFIYGVI